MALRARATQTEVALYKLSGTTFFQSLTLTILANKVGVLLQNYIFLTDQTKAGKNRSMLSRHL